MSPPDQIEVCVIDENDNCPNFTQATFSGQVRPTGSVMSCDVT